MDKQEIDESIFSQSDLLRDMPKNQAIEIFRAGLRKTLQKDEILFNQGDSAEKCDFLLSVRLKLTKLHEDGREAVIRYIGPCGLAAANVSTFKGSARLLTGRTGFFDLSQCEQYLLMGYTILN